MELMLLLALSGLTIVSPVHGHMSQGRTGHGLIGYGINMYQPACASACRSVLSASMLKCSSSTMDMAGMDDMEMDDMTSPECYATDDSFLQSLAFCMNQTCISEPVWQLEEYWKSNVAGRDQVQPDPKISYQQALTEITQSPSQTLISGEDLNATMLVSRDDWQANYNALVNFESQEKIHERYGLVVFLSGIILPIGFSVLRFIPLPRPITSTFRSYFIDPPAFRHRHKTPTANLFHVPTRGQALFVLYLTVLNLVLCFVDLRSVSPNAWYTTSGDEILAYVTNRAGVLSFANVPLLILYAGRNNLLLTVTDWSHDTFLLVHKWVAWIATVEACLHSAIYLQIRVKAGIYASESQLPYWIWGIIGTIAMVILLFTSIFTLRSKMYEVFLAWHVVVAILAVVGCYYHILQRFSHQWGYETWIWVAMAIWGFDRVARFAKTTVNGIRTAEVTVISEDYARIHIKGLRTNGHAYLFFPTLTWRVWENHPFSGTSDFDVPRDDEASIKHEGSDADNDTEKQIATATIASSLDKDIFRKLPDASGTTFIIRTRSGITAQLRGRTSLPVLVESPYRSNYDLSAYRHIIVVAGGVGITAILPVIRAHQDRVKLFWGVRDSKLADLLSNELRPVEKLITIGHRLSIKDLIPEEVHAKKAPSRTAILVCGPPSMTDEVRATVVKLNRSSRSLDVHLIEESFSW